MKKGLSNHFYFIAKYETSMQMGINIAYPNLSSLLKIAQHFKFKRCFKEIHIFFMGSKSMTKLDESFLE